MDDLLTPISTTYTKSKKTIQEDSLLNEKSVAQKSGKPTRPAQISSPDDVIKALNAQPDYDSLVTVLRFLATDSRGSGSFHLQAPGPKSAAIVHLLVTEITPNYWTLLSEDSGSADADLLTRCLASVTGVNAILTHIKALVQEFKAGNKESRRLDLELIISIFLDLLAAILDRDDSIRTLWAASTSRLTDASLKKLQSQAMVTLITSGRVPSLAAEAQAIARQRGTPDSARWIGDGVEYSKWISRNVSSWAKLDAGDGELWVCSELVQRGMSLGYSGMCMTHHEL
jgi:telomere length regulation protein